MAEESMASDSRWTQYRIAKVRRAVNAAFDDAITWTGGRCDGDEIDVARAEIEADRKEAFTLIRSFARLQRELSVEVTP